MGVNGSRTEEQDDDTVEEESSETIEEIELVEVREDGIDSCDLRNFEPPLLALLGEGAAGSLKYSRLLVRPRSPSPSKDG